MQRHPSGVKIRSCRGQDPRFSVLYLSDVCPARPDRNKTVNLPIAIGSAAGEVNMHAILDRLGIVDRHEDMPTGAFSPVPMTISFSRCSVPSSQAPASRTGPGPADHEHQRRCGAVVRACRVCVAHRTSIPPTQGSSGVTGRPHLPRGGRNAAQRREPELGGLCTVHSPSARLLVEDRVGDREPVG